MMKHTCAKIGKLVLVALAATSVLASCKYFAHPSHVSSQAGELTLVLKLEVGAIKVELGAAGTRQLGTVTGIKLLKPASGVLTSQMVPEFKVGELIKFETPDDVTFAVRFTLIDGNRTADCVTKSPARIGVPTDTICEYPQTPIPTAISNDALCTARGGLINAPSCVCQNTPIDLALAADLFRKALDQVCPDPAVTNPNGNQATPTPTGPTSLDTNPVERASRFKAICDAHSGTIMMFGTETACMCAAGGKFRYDLSGYASGAALEALDKELPAQCRQIQ